MNSIDHVNFDPHELYIRWATSEFQKEIETEFQRAVTFDAIASRQSVSAVKMLSYDQLMILAYLLPRGLGIEAPESAAKKFNLSEIEQIALQSFMSARGRLQQEFWPERSQRIGITCQREFKLQFRAARRECDEHIKKIGFAWNAQILRAGPGEWCFVIQKRWGETRIALKLHQVLDLTYWINLDSRQIGAVRATHYLGALGIGPSNWLLEDAGKCGEIVTKAREFIWWHAEECDRLMNDCFTERERSQQ